MVNRPSTKILVTAHLRTSVKHRAPRTGDAMQGREIEATPGVSEAEIHLVGGVSRRLHGLGH